MREWCEDVGVWLLQILGFGLIMVGLILFVWGSHLSTWFAGAGFVVCLLAVPLWIWATSGKIDEGDD